MILKTTLLAAAMTVVGTAAVADYPERPIEVIIAYGPGSNSDTSGRLFINAMRKAMDGADIVPINVAGAGGTVGTAQTASAANDGYTLGYNPIATVTIQPHLRPLPYGQNSFEPICMMAENPTAVQVAPDSPLNSIDDLKAAAEAGNLVSVGPAPGSVPHITQAALANSLGVTFTYLPAGGGGKAAKALFSGEAQVATDNSALAQVQGLKTLAVAAEERLADLPDVPTLKELGIDVSITIWFGLFAPDGTPDDILDTLATACAEAVKDEEFIARMSVSNYFVKHMDRPEFTAFYNGQFEDNASMLKAIGLAK